MATEIRTFRSLKEMNDYLVDQVNQNKVLYEDYSQWLGSLLRDCEATCKNEEWYQKSAGFQKNARSAKKGPEPKQLQKKGREGNGSGSSCWIQSGDLSLSSTEEGEAEILFEAIEEISMKIQGLEKLKGSLQQLERIGLGKNVNYITYIKDDVPQKIVLRNKTEAQTSETYKFVADFTVMGLPP